MNYLDLLIAALLCTCFIAHFFVGTKESLKTKNQDSSLDHYWLQLFQCWHLVSIDLLLYTICYALLGFQIIDHNILRFAIGIIFLGYTISWVLNLIKHKKISYLIKEQPHPFIFLIIAALSFYAYYK